MYVINKKNIYVYTHTKMCITIACVTSQMVTKLQYFQRLHWTRHRGCEHNIDRISHIKEITLKGSLINTSEMSVVIPQPGGNNKAQILNLDHHLVMQSVKWKSDPYRLMSSYVGFLCFHGMKGITHRAFIPTKVFNNTN